MIALVFEAYGAFCVLSLIAFLVLAAVAKLRPDLDEEAFRTLEKLSSFEEFGNVRLVADPIIKHSLRLPPPQFKPSMRLQGPLHSIHTRKHRRPKAA